MSPPVETGRKVAPGPLSAELRTEFTYSIMTIAQPQTPAGPPKAEPKKTSSGPPSDKRGVERQRTRLRAGQLTAKNSKVITDCLIHDRSETGARIKLSQDLPLPPEFLLFDAVARTETRVRLAWQNGCDAGVKLVLL